MHTFINLIPGPLSCIKNMPDSMLIERINGMADGLTRLSPNHECDVAHCEAWLAEARREIATRV